MSAFEANVIGGLFIAAAAMLWLGWTQLPAKIGNFLVPSDFAAVRARRRSWIWLYRVYLFGYVVGVMAFVALGHRRLRPRDAHHRLARGGRAGCRAAGLIMTALAAAFYYHLGAWGSLDMDGKPADIVQGFVDSLRVSTEYVTCLVRFGRVFIGVGQIVLAVGLTLQGSPWPLWLVGFGGSLCLACMGLTLGLPDDMHRYQPVFHLNAVCWRSWVLLSLPRPPCR